MTILARHTFVPITILLLAVANSRSAGLITVDPDAYAAGTVLDTIVPGLSLITASRDNVPFSLFHVTAEVNTLPYPAPTGDKVFAHVGIPFWNDIRRLRMDFDGLVSTISIDFLASNSLGAESGRLEAFGLNGQSLGSYTTQPLFGGSIETMSIQRSQPDIAWAIAYTLDLPGQSDFGRLDHLVFSQPVPVPEPATVGLLLAAGGFFLLRISRRRFRSSR